MFEIFRSYNIIKDFLYNTTYVFVYLVKTLPYRYFIYALFAVSVFRVYDSFSLFQQINKVLTLKSPLFWNVHRFRDGDMPKRPRTPCTFYIQFDVVYIFYAVIVSAHHVGVYHRTNTNIIAWPYKCVLIIITANAIVFFFFCLENIDLSKRDTCIDPLLLYFGIFLTILFCGLWRRQ